MSQTCRLDIILFGATGFTGKLTIPRLTQIIKSEQLSLTWGIAGRSTTKLRKVLSEMQEKCCEDFSDIPVIYANANNTESLEKMTSKARIIINATGPYRDLGEKVIQACIKTCTHHIDISCEIQYMESIQLKYHDVAMEKKIYLISACGFGSVPVDLGVVYLQKNFNGTLNSVETYLHVTSGNGVIHPGTLAHTTTYESVINMFVHRSELQGIRSKLHPEPLPPLEPKLTFNGLYFKNEFLNEWCSTFPSSDRSVSSRTQRYFYETYNRRPVQIETYLVPKNFLQTLCFVLLVLLTILMSMFSWTRRLLFQYPKIFTCGVISSEGPSDEERVKTSFDVTLIGKGWSKITNSTGKFSNPPDKHMVAKVSGQDPGYDLTCVSFVLAAITILNERDKLPKSGGCYTPGAAFADTFIFEKLNKYGVKFELDV